MADIDIFQDDPEDGLEGEGDEGMVSADYDCQDENLSPLQRLEKYMQIENVFSRQMAARSLLDTVRACGDDEEECIGTLKAMSRLSEDQDANVRSELMEQVPHIAMYCQETRDIFPDSIPNYLLPMVVRYLTDTNNQVRKTSQAALLVLLEQELVDKADVEEQVCPVILELTNPESLDIYRTEAVALMSKMAPHIGKVITERIFLPQFTALCTDTLFHVRKVCAANFGDMCSVVGMDATEEHLLPKFFYLCEDGVWGVRKACAECFMAVSCSCSTDVRRHQLAQQFINLLCDQSRWVRIAAFEALGPFISTFADPGVTGLFFDEDGMLCYKRPDMRHRHPGYDSDGFSSDDENVPEHSSDSIETADSNCDKCEDAKPPTASAADNRQIEDMDIENEAKPSTSDGKKVLNVIIPGANSEQDDELTSDNPSDNPTNLCDSENAAETSIEEKLAAKYLSQSSRNNTNSGGDNGGSGDKLAKELNESGEEGSKDKADKKEGATVEASSRDAPGSEERSADMEFSRNVEVTREDIEEAKAKRQEKERTETESSVQSNVSTTSLGDGRLRIHLDNAVDFNSFNFWRTPLPSIDLDFDLVDGKPQNITVKATAMDQRTNQVYSTEMNVSVDDRSLSSRRTLEDINTITKDLKDTHVASERSALVVPSKPARGEEVTAAEPVQIHTASVSTVTDASEETVTHIGSTHVLGHQLSETTLTIVDGVVQDVNVSNSSVGYIDSDVPCTPDTSVQEITSEDGDMTMLTLQDIIPQSLLEHYLSMADPARAQTVDTEIARHCAFSFPAVAYTLGREYWPCLRELYRSLAGDMQWKVRRSLAFSIHELAVIVGEEITARDLVPIYNDFIKDLDEVKIGAVKHLAEFVKLLRPSYRKEYLLRLPDIMRTDNSRNWRYRMDLGEQLVLLCDLYNAEDLSDHLLPVSLKLAADKVCEVRQCAFRLISVLLKTFSEDEDQKYLQGLVNDLIDKFAQSAKWYGRQTFGQLCHFILQGDYDETRFAYDFLPSLLALGNDPIPNVRISLAKVLSQDIMHSDYFTSQRNPHHGDQLRTIQGLQSDCDRDVRYCASLPPQTEIDEELIIAV
ncbi:serine/threonine-protein phosphatase 4 regulatory subunit 1-like isoform X2 [Lineus longissimus]|uniref:serine/threonine-protein phosphatase 4 regulatory subunit 1-like isoform X2 n=1 Tax=Lineus longissimus TaxID=88925 RepID=UPI002B4EDC48